MTTQTSNALDEVNKIRAVMNQSVIGQELIVERLVLALLANGNVLIEGLPGTAKTRSIKTLARVMDAGLSRIQFTPDLLPSDITGTEMYHKVGDKDVLQFQEGPIFNNLILADEINRAPAKVQAALLEAMEERQVTVAGKTYKLPELFMVLATQNPIEQEGTYPLPEAQMDRFIMKLNIDYPDEASEEKIIKLVRSEEQPTSSSDEIKVEQKSIFSAREEIHNTFSSEAIEKYMVALITATREPERYSEDLKKWIEIGASPRGTLALDKCSRTHAWMNGKDHVSPEDVQAVTHDCLRHRIHLSYEASAEGITTNKVLDEIVKLVAVA